ncbi:MAG: SulP family inorganic anion transporter [Planctomycetaceae bacterium]
MAIGKLFSPSTLRYDLVSGLVVFLVALPLCLGVALASNAPLFSGVLSGIIGGLVVGAISRSHTSVSGPTAGQTAIVAALIASLGSFEAFLLALVVAGVTQIVLGIARAGFIAEFFPTSVIKGLLAAIGVILILKQIPHLVGHDTDPEGEMAFQQPDHENTFSEFGKIFNDAHLGTAMIGLLSVGLLLSWDRLKFLQRLPFPAPLIVVITGVLGSELLRVFGGGWEIPSSGFVQVPVVATLAEWPKLFVSPDWSQWLNPSVYLGGLTIAAAASLETLLNLEAVDKIDPRQRRSPPSRELLAQGIGNLTAGLVGAIPVTSVIIRSSVNINAGSKTKLSTLIHGTLLLTAVTFLPQWLNRIPLSCLAAILLVTGGKLASPVLFRRMWKQGLTQFLPFTATVLAIVFTDLLTGILIGMAVSVGFILHSNLQRPLRCIHEHHLQGHLLRIELANQVSFLNRAALQQRLGSFVSGDQVLLDARQTNYIDPDIQDLIHDFVLKTAPVRGVRVGLIGFGDGFGLADTYPDVDNSSSDLQQQLTPEEVLQILKDGNQRFLKGERLIRDLGREVRTTARGQFPLAAVLSCIDSRSPAELIFDLGLGDIFVVRIAGNIAPDKVLGSLEYACAVAGTKLIVVLGHTRCGAVGAAVELFQTQKSAAEATGCEHLESIVDEIQLSIDRDLLTVFSRDRDACVDEVARRNVLRTLASLRRRSGTLDRLIHEEKIAIVGAMYDVASGRVEFLSHA